MSEVRFVPAGVILRTTSGKLAAWACRAEYLTGTLGCGAARPRVDSDLTHTATRTSCVSALNQREGGRAGPLLANAAGRSAYTCGGSGRLLKDWSCANTKLLVEGEIVSPAPSKSTHASNRTSRTSSRTTTCPTTSSGFFLDPTRTYSCAYFERDDLTLEEAQLSPRSTCRWAGWVCSPG